MRPQSCAAQAVGEPQLSGAGVGARFLPRPGSQHSGSAGRSLSAATAVLLWQQEPTASWGQLSVAGFQKVFTCGH